MNHKVNTKTIWVVCQSSVCGTIFQGATGRREEGGREEERRGRKEGREKEGGGEREGERGRGREKEMEQEGREEGKEEEKKEVFITLILPETLHVQQGCAPIGLSSYERTSEYVPLPLQ